MKKITKLFLASVVLMALAFGASAQSTASATASATILTAISITKTVDMNFGNISVQAATGGTVILTTAGVRSATGGVTLPATGGTVTAAAFTIGGEGSYTYSITLPVVDHIISNGANTMKVNTFLSNPAIFGTLSTGTQTLTVGATLIVAAAQANGLYVSETGFNVTVNYN
jgi:hypothetical protein